RFKGNHLAGVESLAQLFQRGGRDVGVEIHRRLAHQLLARAAQTLARLAVDVQDDAAVVLKVKGVAGVVPAAPDALLALAQRPLRLAQAGDVGAAADPLDDPAGAVADRHAARLEPAVDAAAAADAVLDVVGTAARHGVRPEAPRRLAVVG